MEPVTGLKKHVQSEMRDDVVKVLHYVLLVLSDNVTIHYNNITYFLLRDYQILFLTVRNLVFHLSVKTCLKPICRSGSVTSSLLLPYFVGTGRKIIRSNVLIHNAS